jgi:hypothetical protein
MKRPLVLSLAVIVLITAACAGKTKKPFQRLAGEFVSPVQITKPVDQNSSAIGITIKTDRWMLGSEDRVYLVKIESDRDLYQGSILIPTSIVAPRAGDGGGGTVYLQNLPPGRYAAVAFSVSERGFGKVREVTLYLLPKEMVKATDTTVTAGSIAFMGEYEMGPSTMVLNEKAADEVQEHYFEMFWGKPLPDVVAELNVIGTPAYFSVHTVKLAKGRRDAISEGRFLETAKRDLEPNWAAIIDRRRTAAK